MDDKFVSLHRWYDQLQQTCADQEIVEKITNRMSLQSDKEVVRSLTLILADEFRRQQRYGEAETILLDLSNQNPAEPVPLIQLAEQKLYFEQKPDEALMVVEKAVERAYASRNYRRYALGVKARIAEQLRRYDLIEDVLRILMTIKFDATSADVGIERDFVDRIPAGTIDATLLKKYDKFCRRGNS